MFCKMQESSIKKLSELVGSIKSNLLGRGHFGDEFELSTTHRARFEVQFFLIVLKTLDLSVLNDVVLCRYRCLCSNSRKKCMQAITQDTKVGTLQAV